MLLLLFYQHYYCFSANLRAILNQLYKLVDQLMLITTIKKLPDVDTVSTVTALRTFIKTGKYRPVIACPPNGT